MPRSRRLLLCLRCQAWMPWMEVVVVVSHRYRKSNWPAPHTCKSYNYTLLLFRDSKEALPYLAICDVVTSTYRMAICHIRRKGCSPSIAPLRHTKVFMKKKKCFIERNALILTSEENTVSSLCMFTIPCKNQQRCSWATDCLMHHGTFSAC